MWSLSRDHSHTWLANPVPPAVPFILWFVFADTWTQKGQLLNAACHFSPKLHRCEVASTGWKLGSVQGVTSTAPSVMLELQLGDFFLSPAATMSPWDPQSSLFNTGLCLKLLCYVLVFIHSSSPSSSYIHVHQTNAGLLFRLQSVQF